MRQRDVLFFAWMKSLLLHVKHGYGDPSEEPITVTFHIDDDDFKVQIRDYGKQCDSSQIQPRCLDQIKPDGLATHFTNEIMDDFNCWAERVKGPLSTMIKKFKSKLTSVKEKKMSIELKLERYAENFFAQTH
jgi:hypothetical protein